MPLSPADDADELLELLLALLMVLVGGVRVSAAEDGPLVAATELLRTSDKWICNPDCALVMDVKLCFYGGIIISIYFSEALREPP